MDLSVFPTIYALIVFVLCFRPLVRRAGAHTDIWFFGWIFLLLHYLMLLIPGEQGTLGMARDLASLWLVQFCALCFLLAAGDGRRARFQSIFVLEIGASLLLQSGLYTFQLHNPWVHLSAAMLLLAPAIHLLSAPDYRNPAVNRLSIAYATLGVALAAASALKANPDLLIGIGIGSAFLSAAYLTFAYAPRMTRGVVLMVAGLSLWALSYPLRSFHILIQTAMIGRAIIDLPRYMLAAGMVLSFLDDYVGKTERLALHDPLTGLPNRRLFENRLDAAIEESRMTQTPVACLVIDVDDFKYINDTFGHPVGDGLLQALAKRLSWNLGPRDLLARTGGDEFTAVLVEAADEYHVRFVAGAMLAAGCVPVSIQQHSINVRISIGIAVSPHDGFDSESLHKAADDAMYQAKRRGGSILAFAGEEVPQIHAV